MSSCWFLVEAGLEITLCIFHYFNILEVYHVGANFCCKFDGRVDTVKARDEGVQLPSGVGPDDKYVIDVSPLYKSGKGHLAR